MRIHPLLGLAGLALAACGQASAAHSPVSYADPACPAVLAAIPSAPPRTVSQAGADIQALQGIGTKGTLLWSLLGNVRADMLNLSFDAGGLRANGAADLTKYRADVHQLRSYCHH
jgi:hypothetical protein